LSELFAKRRFVAVVDVDAIKLPLKTRLSSSRKKQPKTTENKANSGTDSARRRRCAQSMHLF